jgi:hypothetical protein
VAKITAPGSNPSETPRWRWRPALVLLAAMIVATVATLAGAYQFALSPVAAPGAPPVQT